MSKKLYFEQGSEECYSLAHHIDNMRLFDYDHLVLFEAKRDTGSGYFFCTFHMEVGEVSEGGCGRMCEGYDPRNKKNGRCRHAGYCYDQTEKRILLKLIEDQVEIFTFEKFKKAVAKQAKFYPMLSKMKEFNEAFLRAAFESNQSPVDCCNSMTEVV